MLFAILNMLSLVSTEKEIRLKVQYEPRLTLLQARLVQLSFFNLLLVALLGVLLRSFPFLQSFPLSYKNVLHGHSHFAFGGWIMPVLFALVLRFFPECTQKVSYQHWRNIAVLLLFSAYGMLLSFPIQGYKAVSIFFSTLSVAAGFYLTIVVWQALRRVQTTVSTLFLRWGVVYLTLSAIGPFATGPLISMGYQGSPLYHNAVYFYLHFQYNGWFTFAVLALLYRLMEQNGGTINNKVVFLLLNATCLPTYFLSILWNQPNMVFNIVGGLSALIQLLAFFYLLKDIKTYAKSFKIGGLFTLVLIAYFLKLVLQLISTFPSIALLAYHNRNFVIAYLHLVLLGFISLFAIAAIIHTYKIKWRGHLKIGIALFLFSFCTTESLLILQALGGIYGFVIRDYSSLLLCFSLCFPLSLIFIGNGVYKTTSKQQPATNTYKTSLESENDFVTIMQ